MRNRRESDNDNEITQTVFGDLITFLMVLFLLLFLFSQNDKFEGFISNNLQNDNFNKVKQSYNETLSGEKIISKQITKIRKVEENKQEKLKDIEKLIEKLLAKLNKQKDQTNNQDSQKNQKQLQKTIQIEKRYQKEIKDLITEINKDIPTLASITSIQNMLTKHVQTAQQSKNNVIKLETEIQKNIPSETSAAKDTEEIKQTIQKIKKSLTSESKQLSKKQQIQIEIILSDILKSQKKLQDIQTPNKETQLQQHSQSQKLTKELKDIQQNKPIKELKKLKKQLDKAITENDINLIKKLLKKIKNILKKEELNDQNILKELEKINNKSLKKTLQKIKAQTELQKTKEQLKQKQKDLKNAQSENKKESLKKEITSLLSDIDNVNNKKQLEQKINQLKQESQSQQSQVNSSTEITYLKKEQQLISSMQKLMNAYNLNINQPKTKQLKLLSKELHQSINKEKSSQNEKIKIINEINKILKDKNQIKTVQTAEKLEDELNYLNSVIKKQASKKNSETNITYINNQKKLIADMQNLLNEILPNITENSIKKLKDTNSDLKNIKSPNKKAIPSLLSDIQKLEDKKHQQRSKIQKDEALNALKDIKIYLKGQTLHEDNKALKDIQKELDVYQIKLSKDHKIDINELKDIIQKLKDLAKDKNTLMFKGKQDEKLIDTLNKMASDLNKKKSLDELLQKLQNALNDYKKEAKIEALEDQFKKLNASNTEKLKEYLNEYETQKLNNKESYIINKLKSVISKENKRETTLKQKHAQQLLTKLKKEINPTDINSLMDQLNKQLDNDQSLSEQKNLEDLLKILKSDNSNPKELIKKIEKSTQLKETQKSLKENLNKNQTQNAIASNELSKLEKLLNKLLKTIKDEPISRPENLFSLPKILNLNEQNNNIYVINNDKHVKVILSNEILFASGKASINSNSKKLLLQITKLLNDVKNEIVIAGHTDNVPINNEEFESNWELSFFRSYNVLKYILKNTTLNPTQLSCVGYGEYKPIKPNNSAKNRAKNRRIEIIIIKDPK